MQRLRFVSCWKPYTNALWRCVGVPWAVSFQLSAEIWFKASV
jgi:hypothetical protein